MKDHYFLPPDRVQFVIRAKHYYPIYIELHTNLSLKKHGPTS